MNITVHEYNTAIEGQKMQSQVLRRQVQEKIEAINQLAAKVNEQANGIKAMDQLIRDMQREGVEIHSAAEQLARYARKEECFLNTDSPSPLRPVFNAILDLMKENADLSVQLGVARHRARKRK